MDDNSQLVLYESEFYTRKNVIDPDFRIKRVLDAGVDNKLTDHYKLEDLARYFSRTDLKLENNKYLDRLIKDMFNSSINLH